MGMSGLLVSCKESCGGRCDAAPPPISLDDLRENPVNAGDLMHDHPLGANCKRLFTSRSRRHLPLAASLLGFARERSLLDLIKRDC